MLKKMSYLLVCLFVVGLCTANSLAAGSTGTLAEDDFNDNILDTNIWCSPAYMEENGLITELRQRLEYTSMGIPVAPAEENIANYTLDRNLAYNNTWTVTVDVCVEDYGLASSDHTYAMGIGIYSPDAADSAVFFELARGKDGGDSYVDWTIYNEVGNNNYGCGTNSAGTGVTGGSIELVWNINGNHKLQAYYVEDGSSYQTTLTDDDGFELGWDWGTTTAENRYFHMSLGGYDEGTGQALGDGSKMYADNFVVVPEPITLSFLAMGGLVTLIRRKR